MMDKNELSDEDRFDHNANPTAEGVQHAIIIAMRDLCENNDDTVWLTSYETVFERLSHIYLIAGGKREILKELWPDNF